MQAGRRRRAGLAALGVVALLVHVLAFSGLGGAWPQRTPAAPLAPAVQVRLIEPEPVASPAVPTIVAEAAAVPREIAKPAPVKAARPRSAAVPTVVPALVPAVVQVATRQPEAAEMQVAVTAPSVVVAAAAPPEAAPTADAIPHYRTQMPPAITLHYVMQRGSLRGNGDLAWRPDGDRYELTLEGRVAGIAVLTQVSSGGFDSAGVAPLRFTDQRLRRGTKAANFQRAAGKVTFSGPPVEFALHEGMQDRLSWMVQLGAIVAAEPKLRGVGAKVVMHVVGANGDASVWAFDCAAVETVATGAGSVDALKFVREPREPYDTQVQVWVDPARHYLPVRAMQRSGSGDEVFELRLQSVDGS